MTGVYSCDPAPGAVLAVGAETLALIDRSDEGVKGTSEFFQGTGSRWAFRPFGHGFTSASVDYNSLAYFDKLALVLHSSE